MKQILTTLLLLVLCFEAAAEDLPIMRISVENSSTHIQTITVATFARNLQAKTAGILDIRFSAAGSLVRDSEAARAMAMGDLEMAVPGTWHISALVPEVALLLLPAFYGQQAEIFHRVIAGPIGEQLVRLIENDLFVVVPGRWLDLGHVHLFTTTEQITAYEDIEGMPIRVAGGYVNEARIAAMGGIPTIIAWADLSVRLHQQVVTGVLTTYESVRSAQLWDSGISYAFEDDQYFGQYVPMISRRFWDQLSPELQELIQETWEEAVKESEEEARWSQARAREEAMAHGIIITLPTEQERAQMRNRLLHEQTAIARSLGIPLDLVQTLMTYLTEMGALP